MISDHFPNVRGLIIDMDGVLWHDLNPIGDLPALFNAMRDQGYQFIMATNNATRTVAEYHQILNDFGVFLESWQIINAAQATASFLLEKYPNGCRVYVVGQPSLKDTLREHGHTVVDETANDVQVVVGSLDYDLTYHKIKHASLLIQNGCEFYGTNPDVTLPTPEGLIPGGGTVIGAIELASMHKAVMIGKPEPLLYQMALKRLALSPEETLGIGDRLETDIAGAQAAGIHSALVLSGASSLGQARQFNPPPEIITANLMELIF